MKNLLILLCLCLTAALAKGQEHKPFSPQKFQEELEAYITKEACLTSKEAEAFFPLFREMGKKQREVYHKRLQGYKLPCSGKIQHRGSFTTVEHRDHKIGVPV